MSDSICPSKATVRKDVLNRRNLLNSEEASRKSSKIQDRVIKLEEYLGANVIGIYLPISTEVETLQIINHSLLNKKIVGLPRIEYDNNLCFYRVEDDDLKHNLVTRPIFSIKEPKALKSMLIETIDVLIVPGIAFDKQGARIGYGFGYYDRYMAKKAYKKALGLAYDFQIFDHIPSALSYDQNIDIIVSENQVLVC
jgi:5-formyltetrahydrofolate cyclo-ligase